jgi:RHS repeat-associated protein
VGCFSKINRFTTGKTYGYSSENLLTSASGGVTLGYDPSMRLYQFAGASTTRFAYDGVDMIAEHNGSDTLQRRFVHGPGLDEPLVQYEGTGTADRRFLHADERGSIIASSDGSGAMLAINRYDEYGKPQATNAGRFQYTGQMWLGEIGLYHYKARAYAPHLGRFLQTDPIGYDGDGPNLYAYVLNDPVNLIDPLGLQAVEEITVEGSKRKDGSSFGGTSFSYVGGGTSAGAAEAAAARMERQKTGAAEEGEEVIVTAYWAREMRRGHPIARLGLQFRLGGNASRAVVKARELLLGAILNTPIDTPRGRRYPNLAEARRIYQRIRVALIKADAQARAADAAQRIGVPGRLSAGQIYDYHVEVFAKSGINPTAFGGAFPFGTRSWANTISPLWCPACDD